MTIQQNLFRRPTSSSRRSTTCSRALLDGAALVILVVIVFLMNVARRRHHARRAAAVSLIAAAVAMNWFGFTLNTHEPGRAGDRDRRAGRRRDHRRRERRAAPAAERRTAGSRAHERAVAWCITPAPKIRASVVFATVIVVLVFVPLFLLGSVEGRLLRPLGFAYVVALVASLVVALTVTPVLCSLLLPQRQIDRQRRRAAADTAAQGASTSRGCIAPFGRGDRSIAGAAVALIAALGRSSSARAAPSCRSSTKARSRSARSPFRAPASRSPNALGTALERLLLSVPEVASTARRTGRAELDEHVQGVESAEIDVRLEMKDRPQGRGARARSARRSSLLPGTNVTIGQPISHRIDHMLSGTRANIAVKIFGDDLATLRALATAGAGRDGAASGRRRSVDRAADRHPDAAGEGRSATRRRATGCQPGARRARRSQTALVGRAVGQVLEGQIGVPLVVRYRASESSDLDAIRRHAASTPRRRAGSAVGAFADIQRDRGPNFIMRENVQRRIVVQCNVAGRDLRSVVRRDSGSASRRT